ncbi:hypothetical protein CJ030_MR8G000763 [Morella rubra]|uniref:Uncharacterized protein n=1 Tax=Morella rubra TaxID=262757 RepID=A0A6A1UWL8_9ROSI|nr:hypothetical protein CJ030_MR8G000763 [Morella rubra]
MGSMYTKGQVSGLAFNSCPRRMGRLDCAMSKPEPRKDCEDEFLFMIPKAHSRLNWVNRMLTNGFNQAGDHVPIYIEGLNTVVWIKDFGKNLRLLSYFTRGFSSEFGGLHSLPMALDVYEANESPGFAGCLWEIGGYDCNRLVYYCLSGDKHRRFDRFAYNILNNGQQSQLGIHGVGDTWALDSRRLSPSHVRNKESFRSVARNFFASSILRSYLS